MTLQGRELLQPSTLKHTCRTYTCFNSLILKLLDCNTFENCCYRPYPPNPPRHYQTSGICNLSSLLKLLYKLNRQAPQPRNRSRYKPQLLSDTCRPGGSVFLKARVAVEIKPHSQLITRRFKGQYRMVPCMFPLTSSVPCNGNRKLSYGKLQATYLQRNNCQSFGFAQPPTKPLLVSGLSTAKTVRALYKEPCRPKRREACHLNRKPCHPERK